MSLIDASIEQSVWRCSSPNRYLIFIPKKGYCFAGSFQFQCLFGEITVSGYTAKSNVFSEENFIPFTVHNKAQIPINFIPSDNPDQGNNAELLFQRIRLIMEGSIDDFKSFSHYPAAILVDATPTFLESYLTSRITDYRKPLDKFKYYKVAEECYIVQGLQLKSNTLMPLESHIDNEPLINEAIGYVRNNGTTLMLTGNKDVGKSTLMRYVVNRVLSESDVAVYLLDADIGQTEFTPPGCVSLFKIESPILTPPFLHQFKDFPNTFCVGSLSPDGLDRNVFLRSLQQLFWDFKSITNLKKFLVINTHGWIDGPGFAIMKELITMTNPTTIVNIYGTNIANLQIPSVSPTQHFYQYQTKSRINQQTCREVKSKSWREFAITGYFANCLQEERFGKLVPDRTLANLLSYQVFFDKVALCFHHERPPITDNLIFSSLNCMIVALCGFMPGIDKSELKERYICNDKKWPKIISFKKMENDPLLKCFGFGFIRGVSLEKKAFYIISPISQEDCKKIEYFFVPHNINTPNYMFDRDDASSAPYLVEFKNEKERQRAIKNRNECLRLLSSKFQNNTGVRSTLRVKRLRETAHSTKSTSSPTNKKARR